MVKVDGFKNVEVNFAKKEAVVTYDPSKTTPEKLAQAVEKGAGFKTSVKSTK